MRRLRWIIYAPVALIALLSSPAVAQDVIVWTCMSDTQWQMSQPIADYQAGLYPSWSDCEAWRDGVPGEGWQWSYGASVSSSTVAVTSTVPLSTTSSLPAESSTSTTELPATTVETPTTTSQPTPTTQQTQQTEAPVQPTETTEATTTTVETTTTTSSSTTTQPAPTSTALPSTSLPPASESTTPTVTTPPTFLTVESEPDGEVTLPADASEEEREEFEEQVDIFDGSHDDYVPLGSTITVAQRRTIVAATTILMTLPTPSASRRRT